MASLQSTCLYEIMSVAIMSRNRAHVSTHSQNSQHAPYCTPPNRSHCPKLEASARLEAKKATHSDVIPSEERREEVVKTMRNNRALLIRIKQCTSATISTIERTAQDRLLELRFCNTLLSLNGTARAYICGQMR